MTRYALTIHPDDAGQWKAMTGRDETRPYAMPPLDSRRSVDYMLASAERNGVRVLGWHEIDEEQPDAGSETRPNYETRNVS